MQEIVQQVYQSAFNNLTANGEEFPTGFTFPWVHKGRFVRIPRYQDEFSTFGAATAMVHKNGLIDVVSSYGHRRLFVDPELAGQFLAEV